MSVPRCEQYAGKDGEADERVVVAGVHDHERRDGIETDECDGSGTPGTSGDQHERR